MWKQTMSTVAVDNFSTANLPHSLSNAKGYVFGEEVEKS